MTKKGTKPSNNPKQPITWEASIVPAKTLGFQHSENSDK
jgi:hypothetical protein